MIAGRLPRMIALRLLAVWAALTVDFLLPHLLPGDPAAMLLARMGGEMRPESIEALRAAFGLSDGPLVEQYLSWLWRVGHGDLGTSIARFPEPVLGVILGALPWTVLLAGGATLIAFVLGSALGLAAVRWPGTAWERVLPPVLVLLGAFPYYWLALGALWGGAVWLGWFPVRHAWGPGVEPSVSLSFLLDLTWHALLPASTLVAAGTGGWLIGMRAALLSVAHEPYVMFARARGLGERRIFAAYLLRMALVPQAASLGLALGYVVSGALLTEMVFGWPGQGWLLLEAVRTQDLPLLQGVFLVLTLAVITCGAVVDVVVSWLDPRTGGLT